VAVRGADAALPFAEDVGAIVGGCEGEEAHEGCGEGEEMHGGNNVD